MRKVLFTSGGLAACACVLVALLAGGCGSAPGPSAARQPAAGAEPAPAAAATNEPRVAARLQEISVREGAPGMQVDLRTDQPVVWTSYRDGIGALVIELPDTLPADGLGNVPGEGLLAGIEVVAETGGERPLTRLTVQAREEFEYSLASENDVLRLRMVAHESALGEATVLQPLRSMHVSEGERPAALLAHGLQRAWLFADRIVWRIAATPEDSSPRTTGTLSTVARRRIAEAPSPGLPRVS